MNKENKKMAQQRRAAEREKKEKQAKMKRLGALLAVVVVVGLLVFVTVKEVKAPDADTATEDGTQADVGATEGTDAQPAAEEGAPTLKTEEGLVVKEGDTVNIDYTGYKDGVAFDGGSTNGEGTDLTIGSKMYIDGFEDGLIGHKVGETVDLNLTFPEDYGATDLAGADVVFTVTINGIYE